MYSQALTAFMLCVLATWRLVTILAAREARGSSLLSSLPVKKEREGMMDQHQQEWTAFIHCALEASVGSTIICSQETQYIASFLVP